MDNSNVGGKAMTKFQASQVRAAESAERNASAPNIPDKMRQFWLAVAREHRKAAQQ